MYTVALDYRAAASGLDVIMISGAGGGGGEHTHSLLISFE